MGYTTAVQSVEFTDFVYASKKLLRSDSKERDFHTWKGIERYPLLRSGV